MPICSSLDNQNQISIIQSSILFFENIHHQNNSFKNFQSIIIVLLLIMYKSWHHQLTNKNVKDSLFYYELVKEFLATRIAARIVSC